ncbi:Mre11 DNA-binding presumed domain-containing protein [Neohortaea acidophila]|uniref:Double-strand break repair protein n=1 Tax=Neohortaea acidophila TaxID=245834 RepID=A0A6A6PTT7_9PEZI|nr:Mre11 DNA-binding presumed domain-containing protein [Neohortaea acidophila]KAF2482873.1 Mre11 DNA-binding presumed domain-containing protein [Neohortaea acidophila]
MPSFSPADTIRILVATDNHVGAFEKDPIRGDDSWKSFHEVMCLAKDRDVDMVLLAGDLFHENNPSRKSMYQVMRSLRMNCYGEKPCELEMLSDGSEVFAGAFNHVNYEDPDINVAIPVFSIHGNHDDPSGTGHFAALDLLQMSGLVNYYGRTPESDNILIKPVLLQKGNTKLALYGMSNVRDERLFRTFRDGHVKFFKPGTQQNDWFNIMSVHQNHHAHSPTNYLPEDYLPDFLDLVVWGHEHECKIDPTQSPGVGFKVMQPGSSIATSMDEGEGVPKHVAIVSVHGRDFDVEKIRLKTVRPFRYKEVVLQDDKAMKKVAFDDDNAPKVHAYLTRIIDQLIEEAKAEWLELQRESGEELDEDTEAPKPLIRVRVEYTAPEGGNFQLENPQRFSNRFSERVANVKDVVAFFRKRTATTRATKSEVELPDTGALAQMSLDRVKVGKLVDEYLAAQSLSILPQNFFSDAVGQYVDNNDSNAMREFVAQSLKKQVDELVAAGAEDDDAAEMEISDRMEQIKQAQELAFEKGQLKLLKKPAKRLPKPRGWDSDEDGHWVDNVLSIAGPEDAVEEAVSEEEDDEANGSPTPKGRGTRGGRGRGRGGKATAAAARKTAAAKKAPAKKPTSAKGRRKQVSEDEEEDDDDVIMLDDDDDDAEEEESQGLFVTQSKAAPAKSRGAKAQPAKPSTRGGKAAAATAKQSQLSFASQSQRSGPAKAVGGRAAASKRMQEPSDDEISDDDDAFEPPSTMGRKR